MASDIVLILTNEDDPHADVMVQLLSRRDVHVVRFDPGDYPEKSALSMKGNEAQWDYILSTQGRVVDFRRVRSIWIRRPSNWESPNIYDRGVGAFIGAERRDAIEGMWESLSVLWVNHPAHERAAHLKPFQLQVASRLGFSIPKTLVTNVPSEVRVFYDECDGNIIYKSLSGSEFEHLGLFILTSPISPSHLERLHQVSTAPCLFQEYIPKEFEVRVTVVGGEVFSAAIYSQELEETKHDWRRGVDLPLRYEPYPLPVHIEKLTLQLVSELKLAYGAIDIIVTPEDEHVFLEINPGGQFGFIEHETGLPIYSALADLLAFGEKQYE